LAIAAERCLAAGDKARRAEESRRLAATLTEIAERERRRISQELHDEAGQSMLVIRLMLETIEREAPPVLRDRVREAREATERTVVEIRRILSALSPEVLEKLGLSAAIRQLGTRLRWAYPARLRTDIGDLPRLPAKLELVVYRLAQECLNNAAKHAQAKNVKVSLHNADGVIKLGVSDDGLGFDVGQTAGRNGSYGIGGMRDRVALLGGRMEIDSRPGRGTRVSVELPVPGEERN
jgi:signal transduction histidine kinase